MSHNNPNSLRYRLKGQITGFLEGIRAIIVMPKKIRFLFLTIIMWFLYFLTTYLGFFAIDATKHLAPMTGVTLLAIGSLGILAPVPAGIGTYHFITIATLSMLYDVGSEPATAYAYLSHIMQVFLILSTTGALWVFRLLIKDKNLVLSPEKSQLATPLKSSQDTLPSENI